MIISDLRKLIGMLPSSYDNHEVFVRDSDGWLHPANSLQRSGVVAEEGRLTLEAAPSMYGTNVLDDIKTQQG